MPNPEGPEDSFNVGALTIRIGFWGPLYYNLTSNPKNVFGIYLAPIVGAKLTLVVEVSCIVGFPLSPSKPRALKQQSLSKHDNDPFKSPLKRPQALNPQPQTLNPKP